MEWSGLEALCTASMAGRGRACLRQRGFTTPTRKKLSVESFKRLFRLQLTLFTSNVCKARSELLL